MSTRELEKGGEKIVSHSLLNVSQVQLSARLTQERETSTWRRWQKLIGREGEKDRTSQRIETPKDKREREGLPVKRQSEKKWLREVDGARKNEMRRLEETVQQRSPTLAKFHQLERTRSALSHSRWAALSSVNRGIAATIGGETLPLREPAEDPLLSKTPAMFSCC